MMASAIVPNDDLAEMRSALEMAISLSRLRKGKHLIDGRAKTMDRYGSIHRLEIRAASDRSPADRHDVA